MDISVIAETKREAILNMIEFWDVNGDEIDEMAHIEVELADGICAHFRPQSMT